ncbi:sensor histidine kinase [Bifidobacterium samirii]|uniref:Sensor-like histidine kinase SenX3 n=1 Tax=Bifidobacterium samirii TaxID=2306974 RepID=A0A430FX38_9BIFI|nr:ATP-binding protein [Bifidobacterium samirii]RSX58846.1 Sensor-like histidine kinase senX3 [Bifidobacterium samirii]
MPQQLQTLIVAAPFALMALAAVTMVLFRIYDAVRPLFDNRFAAGVGSGSSRAAADGSVSGGSAAGEDDDEDDEDDDEDGRADVRPGAAAVGGPIARLRARLGARLRTRRRGRCGGAAVSESTKAGDEDLDESTTALLAMLPQAAVVVDRHGEVVRANHAAYTLGVVDDDAIMDDRVREEVRRVLETGERRRFDLTTHTPDSRGADPESALRVQGVTRPNWLKVTVGRIGAFAVILIDDVSGTIRFAQMRDSFIVNVSQQLRKPTQALAQLADSLEDDALDAEQISWNAHQVRASCDRLDHMVADLLLLIEAQEPVMPSSANRVEVARLLADATGIVHDAAARRRVRVDVDCADGLTVNGDAGQLAAAVAKLMHNAVVYSSPGGVVHVAAMPSADGTQALIRVIDQGVGIVKDEQERIFERFYRGSNQTAASRDGIGLGLAIVKHVALAHHGGVTVWSMPGSGATFTLSLPVAL